MKKVDDLKKSGAAPEEIARMEKKKDAAYEHTSAYTARRPTPTTRRYLAQFLGDRLPSDRQPNPNSWARTLAQNYFL